MCLLLKDRKNLKETYHLHTSTKSGWISPARRGPGKATKALKEVKSRVLKTDIWLEHRLTRWIRAPAAWMMKKCKAMTVMKKEATHLNPNMERT